MSQELLVESRQQTAADNATVAVIQASGFVEGKTVRKVHETMVDFIGKDVRRFVFHFADIEYSDLGVLTSLLIKLVDIAEEHSSKLSFIGIPTKITEFLSSIDMMEFFCCFANEEEAIKSLI